MFRCFPKLVVYLFAGFSRQNLQIFYTEKYVLRVNFVNLNHTNQRISFSRRRSGSHRRHCRGCTSPGEPLHGAPLPPLGCASADGHSAGMEELHQLPPLANQKLSELLAGMLRLCPEQRFLHLLVSQQAAQRVPHLALRSGNGFIESSERRLHFVNAGTFSSPILHKLLARISISFYSVIPTSVRCWG